jgi:hypothetical protein
MRVLMALLLGGALLSLASAVTGIQSVYTRSGAGTVVTYSYWYERLLTLSLGAMLAVAFYGIYRRLPLTWRFGFVVMYLCAAEFVFHIWWSLWLEPYGWVGASVGTVFAPFILLYWLAWWRRQRSFFLGDGDEQT